MDGSAPFCYAINAYGAVIGGYGLWKGDLPWAVNSRRPEEIRAPANMIAIGDGTSDPLKSPPPPNLKVCHWGVFGPPYAAFTIAIDTARLRTVGWLHGQGANMVFVDSHVEWKQGWKWVELSDTAARRWNYDNDPHRELWGKP